MFTVEELFSKKNQRNAFAHFEKKKDSAGSDGMRVSELKNYWEMNHERIIQEIKEGVYQPGVIEIYETVNGRGKRRNISSLNVIDRFITRLLSQKMKRYIEPDFMPNSYAYQDGKGMVEAVMKAKEYIESGKLYVAEIDLSDFFDLIPLDKLSSILREYITDERVYKLINSYLYCRIDQDGRVSNKTRGIIQGSSISPILSNIYMHSFDKYLETSGLYWIRFSDNIYIYEETQERASQIFNDVVNLLTQKYSLIINEKKSGVYEGISRIILGYEFYRKDKRIDVRKRQYIKKETYHNWHDCVVQKVNNEYHIVKDGIINKKDYSLLFENDAEKHHIPVEIVNQMNFYSDITITSNVLKTLADKKIKASFFDKYGNLMGCFVPETNYKDTKVILKQCEKYNSPEERLNMARLMELSGLHNMRANVRYYNKRKDLSVYIEALSKGMEELNECKSVDEMLLIEARARQDYYSFFNEILNNKDFAFVKRTRRPPMDELNAMISFGNTLLYNQFLQSIWKTSLDPRISVVHASNRRNHSLNLDFADIFKPVIVDRVIFTLINCQQIKKEEHFEQNDNGGTYLNKAGKRIFLEEFSEKLSTVVVIKGKTYTYKGLMENEVRSYYKHIAYDEKYKPYKYY